MKSVWKTWLVIAGGSWRKGADCRDLILGNCISVCDDREAGSLLPEQGYSVTRISVLPASCLWK